MKKSPFIKILFHFILFIILITPICLFLFIFDIRLIELIAPQIKHYYAYCIDPNSLASSNSISYHSIPSEDPITTKNNHTITHSCPNCGEEIPESLLINKLRISPKAAVIANVRSAFAALWAGGTFFYFFWYINEFFK